MKILTIISDILCFFGVIVIFALKIQDSAMWFKIIMGIICLRWFIKLICDLRKLKHNG